MSDTFRIKNGTRQGLVASPTFWAVYMDPLIEELRTKGIGCHVAGMFLGVCAYADDLALLAPSRQAAQAMLTTCERFAKENNILFSTPEDRNKSKSKELYITGSRIVSEKPKPLILCGQELPYVDHCDHLGHTLNVTATMDQDCSNKRAEFINSAVKTRESFHFAHPLEIITAVDKYSSSFYGSVLYDLRGKAAETVFSSWKTHIKLAWNVPRNCHSYFIDTVLAQAVTSPRVSLMSRFLTFFHSLINSPSPEVQVLS